MPNIALVPELATHIEPLVGVVDSLPTVEPTLQTSTGGAPLEDGRQVTDHAVALPARLSVAGWVSSFGGPDRLKTAWEKIVELQKEVAVLKVITPLGVWDETIIKRADAQQVGKGIRFTLELEEVLRVRIGTGLFGVAGPASGRGGNNERGRVPIPPEGLYYAHLAERDRATEFWARAAGIDYSPQDLEALGRSPEEVLGRLASIRAEAGRRIAGIPVASSQTTTGRTGTNLFLSAGNYQGMTPGSGLPRAVEFLTAGAQRDRAEAALDRRQTVYPPAWRRGTALDRLRPRDLPDYVDEIEDPNLQSAASRRIFGR